VREWLRLNMDEGADGRADIDPRKPPVSTERALKLAHRRKELNRGQLPSIPAAPLSHYLSRVQDRRKLRAVLFAVD